MMETCLSILNYRHPAADQIPALLKLEAHCHTQPGPDRSCPETASCPAHILHSIPRRTSPILSFTSPVNASNNGWQHNLKKRHRLSSLLKPPAFTNATTARLVNHLDSLLQQAQSKREEAIAQAEILARNMVYSALTKIAM